MSLVNKLRKWVPLIHENTEAHIDASAQEAWVEYSGETIVLTFEQVAALYRMCYLSERPKIHVAEAPNPHGDDDHGDPDSPYDSKEDAADTEARNMCGREQDPETGLFV